MGRWMSPDWGEKPSSIPYADLADPQSLNLYTYVRNNPITGVDSDGHDATVTVTTDEEHKKGTINVSASFSIYDANGNALSQDQLNQAAKDIQTSIQSSWGNGTYVQDGITYSVSVSVSVQVAGSQEEAVKSGAQNVIGLVNGPLSKNLDSQTDARLTSGKGPDTGTWNINTLSYTANHEFTHLMGVTDWAAAFQSGQNVSASNPANRQFKATQNDYRWALGGVIDTHREQSRGMTYEHGQKGPPQSSSSTHRLTSVCTPAVVCP